MERKINWVFIWSPDTKYTEKIQKSNKNSLTFITLETKKFFTSSNCHPNDILSFEREARVVYAKDHIEVQIHHSFQIILRHNHTEKVSLFSPLKIENARMQITMISVDSWNESNVERSNVALLARAFRVTEIYRDIRYVWTAETQKKSIKKNESNWIEAFFTLRFGNGLCTHI